ncbi:MAG: sigma-70 family RNA polymerase sigma factor, partial [Alphaproteobacteria bacterium]|nr:sigma-70 family RNA polymerase sigma factor [Alphaproteobacteria bacterium]
MSGAAPASQNGDSLSDTEFKTLLAAVIPHLRAYGRSLSGSPDLADDLTQDTMVKAWASRDRFERGTSIKAWTFVILRNTFLSQMRRNKFVGEYDETAVERTMSTPASQEDSGEMADLQRGLMELPQDQREALILVGAGGMSYEEAASICDCALGTMKSRVSRARSALEDIMNS